MTSMYLTTRAVEKSRFILRPTMNVNMRRKEQKWYVPFFCTKPRKGKCNIIGILGTYIRVYKSHRYVNH